MLSENKDEDIRDEDVAKPVDAEQEGTKKPFAVSAFGSITANLVDGMVLSFSYFGPTGETEAGMSLQKNLLASTTFKNMTQICNACLSYFGFKREMEAGMSLHDTLLASTAFKNMTQICNACLSYFSSKRETEAGIWTL